MPPPMMTMRRMRSIRHIVAQNGGFANSAGARRVRGESDGGQAA
jgi:hypothetical protein